MFEPGAARGTVLAPKSELDASLFGFIGMATNDRREVITLEKK
jgi:hypothetical protein